MPNKSSLVAIQGRRAATHLVMSTSTPIGSSSGAPIHAIPNSAKTAGMLTSRRSRGDLVTGESRFEPGGDRRSVAHDDPCSFFFGHDQTLEGGGIESEHRADRSIAQQPGGDDLATLHDPELVRASASNASNA
jgi:hypothetical protein